MKSEGPWAACPSTWWHLAFHSEFRAPVSASAKELGPVSLHT